MSDLREVARELGVDVEYVDWQGHHRAVGDATLAAVARAFGLDPADPAAALADLRRQRDERVLPPAIVTRAGTGVSLGVAGTVVTEDGRDLTFDDAVPGDLPTGYHRVVVVRDGAVHECALIVTPPRVPWPVTLAEPVWGLALQLYSVRSRGSWEVGDLHDLGTVATWSAREHGADFVLVNPLHAAEVVPPIQPSPYLPTSRRYGNPLYLRVEDIPEYAELPDAQRIEIERFGAQLREKSGELIDRDAAWTAKEQALTLVHAAGLSPERAEAFAEYRAAEGDALARFATWCALSEQHGSDWHAWPADLRDPATATPRPGGWSSTPGCSGSCASSSRPPSARLSAPACGSVSSPISRSA